MMLRILPILLLMVSFLGAFEPDYFWLSWMRAPSETMFIRWVSKDNRPDDKIAFREKGETEWKEASGRHFNMPDDYPYFIHFVELTSLKPNTAYEFRFSDERKVRFFKTAPENLDSPFRFVDGGDMYHDDIEYLKVSLREAAKQDPVFVIAGGDLAYSVPPVWLFKEDAKKWFTFLKAWQDTMQAPDGRIIPIVPVIGNHETIGKYGQTPQEAAFFYALYVTPRKHTNYVLDFGNYLSLIILDSGHTQLIDGPQTEWLKNVLMKRQDRPNKFASYHVPAYPSVRKYTAKVSTKIRENWVPIFELGRLNAAFEHHDHAYKRTFPLLQGKIDEEGVIYLGDGAFGVKEPRVPQDLTSKWYLERAVPVRHFILVTLEGNTRKYQAINHKGALIDQFTR